MDPLFELSLQIPPRGSRNLLRELHTQLRDAILEGRLSAGLRMPSTRTLAARYGVARNTLIAAYDLLTSEGYLETRHGSGTYVAQTLPSPSQGRDGGEDESANELLTPQARELLSVLGRMPPAGRDPAAVPFEVGVPEMRSFPFEVWRRLLSRTQRRLERMSEGLRAPERQHALQGSGNLRAAIVRHASITRALACGQEDILVTAGAQQAFDLLIRVLVIPHQTVVAMEDPGYLRLRFALLAAGARVVPVPVDAEGLVVEKLPEDVRVICVTPSHQFPLGPVMSLRRRTALLAFAHARNAVIIEDDYDGEFRFGETPLDALQTLDRLRRVFYVGTFSKSLFPGLRLGFVVAPPWALAALRAAKRYADGASPELLQETLACFISEGHLARHVRRMRKLYAQRREALLEGLSGQLERWLEPIASAAGLHVTAVCREGVDEAVLLEKARRCGVDLAPLSVTYLGAPQGGFVLGYGALETAELRRGVSLLQRAWGR